MSFFGGQHNNRQGTLASWSIKKFKIFQLDIKLYSWGQLGSIIEQEKDIFFLGRAYLTLVLPFT